uniref:N/A n=1 Tax=Ganoderma boninense TaxID=34458 RepID=A0A5K1K4V5_9APHY|nr:N/A [Ganoderma boninense]
MAEHSSALPSLASRAPCDGADTISSDQYPNVSLATMLMADPVEEALEQTSKCGFEPVGVRLAAAPVSFISRLKHQRRDALDYDKIPSYDRIGPQNSGVPYRSSRTLPSSCKWVPHIHPEGSVYFQQEGWFTNLWLYDEENLRDIDATLELVSREFCRLRVSPRRYEFEICLDVDVTMDEKTMEKVKLGCYYVWDKDAEEVFWLQDTPSSFFNDDIDVKIMGREHLKQVGGIGYW